MLGITNLNTLFPHAGMEANAVAAAGLAVGATGGWLHARRWRLQFNVGQARLLVRLPGDASLLTTLMLTFAAETYLHYAVASAKPWVATSAFVLLSFAFRACSSARRSAARSTWSRAAFDTRTGRATTTALIRSIRIEARRPSERCTSPSSRAEPR